jgi:hypothetical protein
MCQVEKTASKMAAIQRVVQGKGHAANAAIALAAFCATVLSVLAARR